MTDTQTVRNPAATVIGSRSVTGPGAMPIEESHVDGHHMELIADHRGIGGIPHQRVQDSTIHTPIGAEVQQDAFMVDLGMGQCRRDVGAWVRCAVVEGRARLGQAHGLNAK